MLPSLHPIPEATLTFHPGLSPGWVSVVLLYRHLLSEQKGESFPPTLKPMLHLVVLVPKEALGYP